MMILTPFYRSDTPGLDDAAGEGDPPPEGTEPDGETHAEHLRRAYGHMTKCARHLERALLDEEPLDDEPLGGPFSDDEVGPLTGYTDRRSALMRAYAWAIRSSITPNI
jgi:hypothetical protein